MAVARKRKTPRSIGELDLLNECERVGREYVLLMHGWTEQEYWDKAPEDRLCEFWDGVIVLHSPAGPPHQDLVALLTVLLRTYTSRRGLGKILNGPASVRLRPGLVLEPDIFFVPASQSESIGESYVEGAPALAIEVVSRSSRRHDLVEKLEHYRQWGVGEYWAVEREAQQLAVHVFGPDAPEANILRSGRLESVALPGFWIEVDWLWQRPLPSDADLLSLYL